MTTFTLAQNYTINEFKSYLEMKANWDGEGASTPLADSIERAIKFVRLLPETIAIPEPMLHASGYAGLFWSDNGLYADLEFIDNDRIAYFISYKDTNKGVVDFNKEEIPPVFETLLKI